MTIDSALDNKTKAELIAEVETLRRRVADLESAIGDTPERVAESILYERNLLRLLIDILPDNVFVKDTEGRFLLNNTVSMEILGVSRQEELYGKTDFDFFPYDIAKQSRDDEMAILESGEPVMEQEVHQPEKTDKWRWLVYSTIPLRNKQGEIIGLAGMTHDITERKLAEEAVRASEERLRLVTDNIRDMIGQVDEKGFIRYVSPSSVDVWGIPPEEIVGTHMSHWLERIHPDDRELVRENLALRLTKGQGSNLWPYRFIHPSGEVRWKEHAVSPIRKQDGSLAGYVYTIRDITERKQVEAERIRITSELQEREALLSAIVNSRVDLICRYTPDTVLTFVNDAYCHFVGRSREELIGNSFLPMVPEYEHADILARVEEVIFKREPESRERPIMVAGKGTRWVQWVDQAVVDNHGDLLIQAVGRDITAQKEAEDALVDMNRQLEARVRERTADLQAANERLEALSRVKDEFVSNVSHELRTPITSLTIREHLLRKNPERLDYHLEVMERETNRLRITIEELLQLSRLDQKQTQLNLVPIDINTMVKRYVSDRIVIAETRNLTLAFMEAPDLPAIPADEGLLEQTLGILLTNAMNYTPSGGQITVKTLMQQIDALRWVGFSVADNGPGISLKDQSRLFERFFRGETGRASGAAGTGLGLAIAKEIVERHSGIINIESSGIAGEGACFTVLLPEQV